MKSRIIQLLGCLLALPLVARPQNDLGLLTRLTTPVEVKYSDGTPSSGTGFFFQELGPPADPNSTKPQWRAVTKLYLITNRHVIQPQRYDQIVDFTFFLRRTGVTPTGVSPTEWFPIKLPRLELGRRLHLLTSPQIDVAAVEVLDLVNDAIRSPSANEHQTSLAPYAAVSREDFPGVSKIPIASGDDVIVIGYPKLFFDEFNKLPILKRGLLITPWGLHYRGQDSFLIDYHGFHGSSGSIVVSKPTDLILENGKLLSSSTKQFLFLGIYSGEPYKQGPTTETDDAIIQEKARVDIGQVWYFYTIQDTINAPAYDHSTR